MEKKGCNVWEGISFKTLRLANVFHIHWPEAFLNSEGFFGSFVRLIKLFLTIFLVKIFRLKLVWTVHNLKPHENHHPVMAAVFYRLFPRCCNGFVFLSAFTRDASRRAIPAIDHKRSTVIYHGHYKPVLGDLPDKESARSVFGFSSSNRVVLFFGLVRRYKNVPLLIQEFSRSVDPNLRLIVAGNVVNDSSLKNEIVGLAKKDSRVFLRLEHIPEKDLLEYLSASDLIVLPFSDVANSGSVMMALSAGRKVLAPKKGSLEEIQAIVGSDWLRLYDGGLSGGMIDEAGMAQVNGCPPNLIPFGWDLLATQTSDFFAKL